MLALMAKRQSNGPPNVFRVELEKAKVEHLAIQIRKAMVKRGWVYRNGRPDVQELVDRVAPFLAKPPRWATVQAWIDGTINTLPRTKSIQAIAKALGVTTDELIGIVVGGEPTNEAWKAFLLTPQAMSATPRQLQLVARLVVDEGDPTVASYLFMLAAVQSGRAA